MEHLIVAGGLGAGVAGAAFVFGFRHGFDLDHLAAITDITGAQPDKRRSLFLATVYALGHALVVIVLGAIAIALGTYIPPVVDAFMGRVIGFTLVTLGGYLLYSVARHGPDVRLRSRWMIVLDAIKSMTTRKRVHEVVVEHEHDHEHDATHAHGHPDLGIAATSPAPSRVAVATTHRHVHQHRATMPRDPFTGYSAPAALGIGMVHGFGAETPTQVLLFVTAAGVGSRALGIGVLVLFVLGLFVANTLVAVASTFGFTESARSRRLYVGLAVLTASFSLLLGAAYLLGRDDLVARLVGA
jgi:ABC-type nickel/cobalt efflux system permease component RcnA